MALQLSPDERMPRFQRAAHTLTTAIRHGRLRPGQPLPGTRTLAEVLGINRSTVIQAIQELEAEGWVVTEPSRGTFVATELPKGEPRGTRPGARITIAMPGLPIQPGFDLPSRLRPLTQGEASGLDLADGYPDPSLAPLDLLAKAYQRALRLHGDDLLQDQEPLGLGLLRRELVTWYSERRGLGITPGQILVTRGARSALTLISVCLLNPGDAVAVENPGDRAAWDALRQSIPVRLVPVAVDAFGLDVEALDQAIRKHACRMIYTSSRNQFPTTVALSPKRRLQLLELAARHRIPIVEEDRDVDFTYGEGSAMPLGSQDSRGQVIHTMSLGRMLTPGLRLGSIVAPAQLVERLARVQRNLDWQGDPVMAWAAADLIRDGDLARHLRRTRKLYEGRMRFLVERLNEELGGALRAHPPGMGLALWLRLQDGNRAEAWIDAARLQGLVLHRPSHFYLGAPSPFTRMGFAQAGEEVLERAVQTLKAAWVKIG